MPTWRWSLGDVQLERQVAMLHGRPAVAVLHRLLRAPLPVRLELSTLCTWRDAHEERQAGAEPAVDLIADGFIFEGAYRVAGSGFVAGGGRYVGSRWRVEAARGLSDHDDLWHAGDFVAELEVGGTHEVVAWADDLEHRPPPGAEVVASAEKRYQMVVSRSLPSDDVDRHLAHAADQLICGPGCAGRLPVVR